MTLPPAPQAVVGPDGQPRQGRFAGLAQSFAWPELAVPFARSPWWRRFHHKHWHYAALATDEVFCGIAIVDVGWTSTAFVYVFDRRERRVVAAWSRDGLPGLSAQVAQRAQEPSRFRFGGNTLTVGPDGVLAHCRALHIEAHFSGTAPVLLAVGPAQGGSVHATQKSGALALAGDVAAGGKRYRLDGGVASFDYSNGLLGRETAWRWASAHGPALGFNLQAGYFGACENALWLDGEIVPLAAAQFEFDAAAPEGPWQVRTDDGLVDLRFTPEGARREDKNLLVAASRYVQPVGVFNGTVRAAAGAAPVAVVDLVGVTEDHYARW
jgi:hypothetical protein